MQIVTSSSQSPDCEGVASGSLNSVLRNVAESSSVASEPPAARPGRKGGSIPFDWERQPGIPKIRIVKEELPVSPLHPPPSRQGSPSVRSSPRAIFGKAARYAGSENYVSPLQSPLAHSSPGFLSRRLKAGIWSKQRSSMDISPSHYQLHLHATAEKFSNANSDPVSHAHTVSCSTYINGDSEDESVYYTPLYKATPTRSCASGSLSESEWEAGGVHEFQHHPRQDARRIHAGDTSPDLAEMEMLSTDRGASFLCGLQNGDGFLPLAGFSSHEKLRSHQPAEILACCGDESEKNLSVSPGKSQSLASETSPELKPILAGSRHLSMRQPLSAAPPLKAAGSEYEAFGSGFQQKRKLTRSNTMAACDSPCHDPSVKASGNLLSMSSFEFSGKLSSLAPISNQHSHAHAISSTSDNSLPETGADAADHEPQLLQAEPLPSMDLSIFALCRASSVNSTMTTSKRSLYNYDYTSSSMQLLKSVDHHVAALAPSDMDNDISSQFLWLTKDAASARRSAAQAQHPWLRKYRAAARLPFRYFLGKLVPCISAASGHPR